jgi:hypothetical protein
MSDDQKADKKKKRKAQQLAQLPDTEKEEQRQVSEEERLQQVTTLLDDLKKRGKFIDIQLCPHCKSVRIRRVGSMSGDMSGQMAMTLPKFECLDCGWRGRLTIYATNRPLDKKMMAVITDSLESGIER